MGTRVYPSIGGHQNCAREIWLGTSLLGLEGFNKLSLKGLIITINNWFNSFNPKELEGAT